jgi:D-alanyl-D-alanine carboxypeptidase (penicillin-binding protein 5/6)
MTVLVAFDLLKKHQIEPKTLVTVSESAWKQEGSRSFINVGSQVAADDLLRGVIVQSGNDAAVALAELIAGTEEGCAEMLNKKGKELGLKNSTFVNATGMPHENHLMSVRDLAIVAERTIQDHPELYPLYAETEFTYNNIRQPNRNPLLGKAGCDGLKTGFTEAGGYGLVASAQRDGRRLIMVINGSKTAKTRAQDAERLMNWGFTYHSSPRLFATGQPVDQADVWLGTQGQVTLVADRDVYVTLPRSKMYDIKAEFHYQGPVPAPIKKGQQIAEVTLSIPDQNPKSFYLVAAHDVERAGIFSRMRDTFNYLVYGISRH